MPKNLKKSLIQAPTFKKSGLRFTSLEIQGNLSLFKGSKAKPPISSALSNTKFTPLESPHYHNNQTDIISAGLKNNFLTGFNVKFLTGFTVIELLVVMAIIAVLAGIILVNPAGYFAKARNTQRVSNITAILNAVGQYIADQKGVLPSQITTSPQNISSTGADLCALLAPSYIPVLYVDPQIDADGAGPLKTGEPVSSTVCGSAYDTGFQIVKDGNNRITISAPSAELAQAISVTR